MSYTKAGTQAAADLVNLTIQPASIRSGIAPAPIGVITLSAAAPAGGALVNLATDNANLVTLPATVTVPEGSQTTFFSIGVGPLRQPTMVTISGTIDGVTRSATLEVLPAPGVDEPVPAPAGHDTPREISAGSPL